ncbi:hypothetical protein LPJ60_002122 [Coemansia sp. RSA 2675]|nr:hypothetical protein LPJ60_002122 [Coemansia sp. RSA 2675]
MENRGDELHEFLQSLELLQYYEAFRREGFERLESIAEIQETDFEALGVKRGHRRSPYSRPPTESDPQTPRSPKSPVSPQSPKRTYRRHPKKDPNAPEKWRSAYQLFRDDVNRELQGQDIPFSEMSKIHSKRWSQLNGDERATYVERSKVDKQEYKQKMELYEQTLEFKVKSMDATL